MHEKKRAFLSKLVLTAGFLFLAFLTAGCGGNSFRSSEKSEAGKSTAADYIFVNGVVWTMNGKAPHAEAVAVKDGEILYVGDEENSAAYTGAETKIINMKKGMLLPGFIDTHAHPALAGLISRAAVLDSNEGVDRWMADLKKFARKNKDREVLLGFGFNPAQFGPEGPKKELLDEIESEKPVIVIGYGGHTAWVNSKTFEVAGVDAQTPDPIPGAHYYTRNEAGEPAGWCVESQSWLPLLKAANAIDQESAVEGMEGLFSLMNSFGITTVYDAGMMGFEQESYEALQSMEARNRLTLRLITSHMIQNPAALPDAVENLINLKLSYGSDLLRPRVMKIHGDGTSEAYSAAFYEPYQGQPDNYGETLLDVDTLKEFVREVDSAGFDIHIHAIGDRTMHEAVSALTAARKANPESRGKFTIAHAELIPEEDIQRLIDSDIAISTTPYWFPGNGSDEAAAVLGSERSHRIYEFKAFHERGGTLVFGSDFPASEGFAGLVPMINIETGITRKFPAKGAEAVADPEEGLSLQTMIEGYTLKAAQQLDMASEIGSIEVGKKADLILFKKNLFQLDTADLSRQRVQLTMMDGHIVHKRGIKSILIDFMLGIYK